MSMLSLKGNVRVITGLIKQKYASLTDNPVLYVHGREEEYLGNVQRNLEKDLAESARNGGSKTNY